MAKGQVIILIQGIVEGTGNVQVGKEKMEKHERFLFVLYGERSRFTLCHKRRTRWPLYGNRFQMNARDNTQIIPYPKNENG